METIEQVIANIRSRNVELSVDGERIIATQPLLPNEKEALRENRAAAIEIINATSTMPETAEQAYQRGQKDGYAAGIRQATEEFQARPPEAKPVPTPTPTTPDGEVRKLIAWCNMHSDYYKWEDECFEALRAALVPGDRVQPLFAYSCIIIHADGTEREFKRVPDRKK